MRPTIATINLGAIKNNLLFVRKLIPKETKIMAVVKANAYGHGAREVSRYISENKLATYFGVALIEEAIELRKNKIKEPILVFTLPVISQLKLFLEYNIEITLCSLDIAKELNKLALISKKKINAHIKIDTGMGRLGVSKNDAINFIVEVSKLKNINLKGIYTHFASADNKNLDYAKKQLNDFKNIFNQLKLLKIKIPIAHTANSPAILRLPGSHLDLVRPGIIIYGYMGNKILEKNLNLKPSLSLKSKITFLKKVKKGTSISYNHKFVTEAESLIGTIPVGYADGVMRNLTNKLKVLHKGKIYSSVGVICMDQLMVDFYKAKNVKVGDDVILIGKSVKLKQSAWDFAEKINSIPYEVCCAISARVPRIYN
ncbi:MAG: alanine racemase [Bacteroidetes bacterium]|nr:alanine racemase [Bacteroidota bacterium]